MQLQHETKTVQQPCAECPWRTANHGRRDPRKFYTKRNLQRLWNQIRKDGGVQSCHPTDPQHPDHGAKPDSKPQECAGSIVLITREMRIAGNMAGAKDELTPESSEAYLRISNERKGLTRQGLLYHCLMRPTPRPFGEGNPLPAVPTDLLNADWIGRPDETHRQANR